MEKPVDEFGYRPPEKNGKRYVQTYCKKCRFAGQAGKFRKSAAYAKLTQSDEFKKKQREAMKRYNQKRSLLIDAAIQAINAGLIADPRLKA